LLLYFYSDGTLTGSSGSGYWSIKEGNLFTSGGGGSNSYSFEFTENENLIYLEIVSLDSDYSASLSREKRDDE